VPPTSHVLMCEPSHFRIAYEINPWMRITNTVQEAEAAAQWQALHRTLVGLGVDVELVEPAAHVPDMVFTANAGVVAGKRFVPANFRFVERAPEAPLFSRWFADRGYEVLPIEGPRHWEGEGDVLVSNGSVFAASGTRTEPGALDRLDALLGLETVRLELVDPRFYHLDTCFLPLSAECAAYYPPAFSDASRARLEEAFDDLIEVPAEDALRFVCNALLVGRTVVMNTGAEWTARALEERGYECVATPTSEFIKAGGSVKCLVLTLDTFRDPPGVEPRRGDV